MVFSGFRVHHEYSEIWKVLELLFEWIHSAKQTIPNEVMTSSWGFFCLFFWHLTLHYTSKEYRETGIEKIESKSGCPNPGWTLQPTACRIMPYSCIQHQVWIHTSSSPTVMGDSRVEKHDWHCCTVQLLLGSRGNNPSMLWFITLSTWGPVVLVYLESTLCWCKSLCSGATVTKEMCSMLLCTFLPPFRQHEVFWPNSWTKENPV